MSPRYLMLIILLLVGCTTTDTSPQSQSITTGERLISEPFTIANDWMTYNTEQYTVSVTDGVYRMLSTQRGQYIWGTNGQSFENAVIHVDVTWQVSQTDAFAGIVCRLNENSRSGYYGVVSANGDFSIRYISQSVDDALVRWQSNRHIPRSGTFQLRMTCVDDRVALYVDGQYLGGGIDSRLRSGQIALTVGLPSSTSANMVLADFDDFQVWEASHSN